MHIRGHHWYGSVQKRNKQKRVNCSHVNKMCPSGYVHVFLCLQHMVSYLWTVGINRLCARMWKMKISHVIILPTVLIIVFIITTLDISLILFRISFLCWKIMSTWKWIVLRILSFQEWAMRILFDNILPELFPISRIMFDNIH